MKTAGQLLSSKRKVKNISLTRAARDLAIKKENLQAIEEDQWEILPEPPIAKGFIKNYAQYLGLDPDYTLALYRREYDEAKYPKKLSPLIRQKRLLSLITPNRVVIFCTISLVLVFIGYLVIQYFSILAAPKLEVFTPADDLTTQISVVRLTGQTEKGAMLVVDGQFVAVDQEGNFSYELRLEEGRNEIEIIASKRLSPKSKVTKVIRLSR